MFTTHFCGKEISRYGRKNGRVDYRTFASCFDAVLCNGILGYRDSFEDWEQIGGYIDNSEELETLRAELEEVEAKLEEATKEKKEAELDYDKADTAYEGISEILEKFDNFEYDYNELDEALRWNDTETPSGEELDTDDITSQLDCLNWWGMREDIERHQNTAEEERDEAEERFEEAEAEVNKLTKRKAELEEQIEELEAEEDEQQEVYQWYIISDNGAQLIQDYLPYAVLYYNAELDLYVWGVTHYGTAWDYVLTSIPCETLEEQKQREAEEAKPKKTTDFTEDELDSMINELVDLWNESEDEGETTEVEEEPTEDEATPTAEANTAEADEPKQNFEAELLKAWAVICRVENAIADEVETIQHDEDYFYAEECERLMKHRFEVGDIVALEDGGMPWKVIDMDRLADTLLVGQGELDRAECNRWEVFGISSKGEEVRTPCDELELALLRANHAWC